jgi:tetratricopeptide (TPR) repeat protein
MIKRLSVVAFLASLVILVDSALPLPADPPATDPEALIQGGHWKRARAILEAQFRAHPQDPTNLYQLAQVKMAFEDFDGALPLVQHAVELDSKNSNYHLKLGQVYGEMAARASFLSAGRLAAKFRKEVEIALQIDPQNLEALDSMMQFKFQAPGLMGGNKQQARALADKILRLNPSEGYIAKSELAELEKNVAEVEACYRKAVEADPKSYHALTLLAGFYSHDPHAKYNLAVENARRATAVDPSRVEAYGILARAFALEERWSDLDLILTTAQIKVPDDLCPYYEASNALLETGKELPRAEKYAKKYLSEEAEAGEPGAADAHRLLGLVLEKEGRTAEALTEIHTALRLRPDFKAAREDLARLNKH